MTVRAMQSHPIIDTMVGSACCLLCGTLEDPFVGCSHQQDLLFESMLSVKTSMVMVDIDKLLEDVE
jgi:hypothetical protein